MCKLLLAIFQYEFYTFKMSEYCGEKGGINGRGLLKGNIEFGGLSSDLNIHKDALIPERIINNKTSRNVRNVESMNMILFKCSHINHSTKLVICTQPACTKVGCSLLKGKFRTHS